MQSKLIEVFKKIGFVLGAFVIANFVSHFAFGFVFTLIGNVHRWGLDKIGFDPLISMLFIVAFYFSSIYYQLNPKAQYSLFIFTLFLSLVANFVQGAIFLLTLCFLLRKFKII